MVVLLAAVCAAKKMNKMAKHIVVNERNLIWILMASHRTKRQVLKLTSSLSTLRVTITKVNFQIEVQLQIKHRL